LYFVRLAGEALSRLLGGYAIADRFPASRSAAPLLATGRRSARLVPARLPVGKILMHAVGTPDLVRTALAQHQQPVLWSIWLSISMIAAMPVSRSARAGRH
jgi:hypothetical protein